MHFYISPSVLLARCHVTLTHGNRAISYTRHCSLFSQPHFVPYTLISFFGTAWEKGGQPIHFLVGYHCTRPAVPACRQYGVISLPVAMSEIFK
jgi:hypothetical protein